MKIIITDNFNRDYISDRLLCNNICEYWGKHLVTHLNEKFSADNAQDFFKLVDDDYKLFEANY